MKKIPENIVIGKSWKNTLEKFLKEKHYSAIAILIDENTKANCLPIVIEIIDDPVIIEIKSGEEYKNLETCAHIWSVLTKNHFDRKALMINLGGGVIGDMGGFCATAYKRGIDFINLPTTLLSQVDASVGGKLGIDFQGFKNHIGFFKEPEMVLINPGFLNTLPERELRSGFAEVLKHALIADEAYWKILTTKKFPNQPWEEHILHSVKVKYEVVSDDFKESGQRKILNFGHTLGHAIESIFLDKGDAKLLHGEAIAIGMITEAYISMKYGLKQEEVDEIAAYFISCFGKIDLKEVPKQQIFDFVKQDKKNTSSQINFSLLKNIGCADYNLFADDDEISQALAYYQSL